MDNFLVMYIARRMKDLGFGQYSFEPFIVATSVNQTEYVIGSVNEYYYLASKQLAIGIEFWADNHCFRVEDYYVNLDFSIIQEFTGHISIRLPPNTGKQVIEFIRVIPFD